MEQFCQELLASDASHLTAPWASRGKKPEPLQQWSPTFSSTRSVFELKCSPGSTCAQGGGSHCYTLYFVPREWHNATCLLPLGCTIPPACALGKGWGGQAECLHAHARTHSATPKYFFPLHLWRWGTETEIDCQSSIIDQSIMIYRLVTTALKLELKTHSLCASHAERRHYTPCPVGYNGRMNVTIHSTVAGRGSQDCFGSWSYKPRTLRPIQSPTVN